MRPDLTLISIYPRLGSRHDGDSGVSSYTANLAHALAAAGADVCVVAPHLDGEPTIGQDGPVQVRRTFEARTPGAVPAAFRAARATGAPIVHLQHELFLYSGPAGLAPTMATLRSRRRDPASRTVVTMHQVVRPAAVTAEYTRMHRIRVPAIAARVAIGTVQRLIPRLTDAVIVHEPAFTATIPGSRHIPHGIETPAPSAESPAQVRRRLGINDDRLLALCFGFIAPYKGVETALEAVRGRTERIHLVVAGGGHPRLVAQGDDYAERLRSDHQDLATFTGYVGDDHVSDWFRAADVALQCYPEPHASSGPLALALAHGTPVLLSARLAETVGADRALTVTDPDGWGIVLEQLAAEPAAMDALRSASSELAADRGWPAVARRHLEVYREVTDHDHRSVAAGLAIA